MPSRPVGLWTRLEVFFNGSKAKEWSNIFWFQQSGAVPAGDIPGDAALLKDWCTVPFSNVMSSSNSSVGAQVLVNNGAGSYGSEDYGVVPGTLGGDPIPEDNAVVVQRLTAQFGASNRGRVYVAGIDNSLVEGSYLNAAGVAAFFAIEGQLQNTVVGATATYTPFFFSPTTGNFLAITAWTSVLLIGTNRKRRPRF